METQKNCKSCKYFAQCFCGELKCDLIGYINTHNKWVETSESGRDL